MHLFCARTPADFKMKSTVCSSLQTAIPMSTWTAAADSPFCPSHATGKAKNQPERGGGGRGGGRGAEEEWGRKGKGSLAHEGFTVENRDTFQVQQQRRLRVCAGLAFSRVEHIPGNRHLVSAAAVEPCVFRTQPRVLDDNVWLTKRSGF